MNDERKGNLIGGAIVAFTILGFVALVVQAVNYQTRQEHETMRHCMEMPECEVQLQWSDKQ